MNTPVSKCKLRIGLSKPSSLSKSILTPSSTSKSASNSSTTPLSTKTPTNRAGITKKQLKFAANQLLEEEKEPQTCEKLEDLDEESLKAIVEERRETLRLLERHEVEKKELMELTDRWKEAGLTGLEELKKIMKQPYTTKELLDSFKIPHEMFLSEDED